MLFWEASHYLTSSTLLTAFIYSITDLLNFIYIFYYHLQLFPETFAFSDKVIHRIYLFFQNTRAGPTSAFLTIVKGYFQSNKFCQIVHYFHICAFLMPQGTESLAFSFKKAKQ